MMKVLVAAIAAACLVGHCQARDNTAAEIEVSSASSRKITEYIDDFYIVAPLSGELCVIGDVEPDLRAVWQFLPDRHSPIKTQSICPRPFKSVKIDLYNGTDNFVMNLESEFPATPVVQDVTTSELRHVSNTSRAIRRPLMRWAPKNYTDINQKVDDGIHYFLRISEVTLAANPCTRDSEPFQIVKSVNATV